ncbi:MAG TPA: DinB family protein [Gemmatimonadaceae bacterium]
MLLYTRQTTLAAVEGMSTAQLDHLHDDSSNSIGALLAHIAVSERGYQCLTFEDRTPTVEERAAWEPALTLGAEGRRLIRGKPLEHYVRELDEVRRRTLEGLAARDDVWLEQALSAAPAMNAHFAWFHIVGHETNHRGQIRWLRARLPSITRVGG